MGSHLTRLTKPNPATSLRTKEPKDTMRLQKTVVVDKPPTAVFDYLSDFTTTTDWDPGTVVTVNHHGDGGVGTTYLNTSTFLGRQTQLTYIVREFVPGATGPGHPGANAGPASGTGSSANPEPLASGEPNASHPDRASAALERSNAAEVRENP